VIYESRFCFKTKKHIFFGVNFDEMCSSVDFIAVVGGDGTLISVCRRAYKYDKPVLGINAGNLGFLTDINPDNIEEFLDQFLAGKYRIDERMVIEIIFDNKKLYAFNDVVISKDVISSMINIQVDTNESFLNTYRGDGLIFSTPTGSTAYNLSAGGLEVKVKEDFAKLIIDGQEIYSINNKIVLKKAKKPTRLIHRLERNYFEVLREKLHWGEGK